MAGFTVQRYDVDEAAVRSYIQPGGKVYDVIFDVIRDAKAYSIAYVANGHVRSGRLLKGIQSTNPKSTGPLTTAGQVRSTARHSIFFLEKTGPITAKMMLVPKDRGTAHHDRTTKGVGSTLFRAWDAGGRDEPRQFYRTKTVKGYRAHPFLTEGRDVALAKQGLK